MFTKEDITGIYVATFNRAPDAQGLNYWMNDSGLDNIEDVASSFFDSTEAQEMYSATSSSYMVETAYQNLFAREADTEGLAYWTNELDNGYFSQSLMLQAMSNGALGQDAMILENKTTVGLDYAERGIDDMNNALSVMDNITYEYSSVEDAYELMNSMGNGFDGFGGGIFGMGVSGGVMSNGYLA